MARINRWAVGKDKNEKAIVEALRKIPGVTVELHHDDALVGRVVDGVPRTFWFEIKNPDKLGKDGNIRPSEIKPDQQRILDTWTGNYSIVWSLEQILKEIGINT